MSANTLLLWMSARRQGSWQQFRSAVEELHVGEGSEIEGEDDDAPDQFALRLYQTLRFNLQRVGHAEFFAGAGDGVDWRVAPPSLAVVQHARGWLGTFVGARSLGLQARLYGAAGAANLQTLVFPAYPDQILVTGSDQPALAALAEQAGLLLQNDAPAALLTSLPSVDDPCVRHPAQLPFGANWKIDRFSADDLTWRSATLDEAAAASGGLFRFSLRHQRYVLFCGRGAASRIPGQVGKYLVLRRRRRQVLRYDDQRRSLAVPASCRPPFLVERALILCSGSPPLYEDSSRGGFLRYAEIPEGIAALTASLLRQELR
jgi:hypothetical protein